MRKILHIPKFYSPYKGGIESTCKYIIDNLSNYEHRVICFNSSFSTKIEIVDGISVKRIRTFCKISSQNLSFSYYFELKKILKEYKPDLIHFHAPNPLIMKYLLDLLPESCKLVVHWHSDIVEQRILYKLVSKTEQEFLKRADRVFITSPNYLEGSRPLASFTSKTNVIPSAIDPSQFILSVEEETKKQKILESYCGKNIIFFVGRHVLYKGLKYLLQAEKLIKSDCVILIAGSGPLTYSLKQKYFSERIKFLGRVSDNDLKIYFHLADVFAFPSITKNEAFGLVLAEAMFCETPAITFTIEGSGVNWVNLNGVTGLEVENCNYNLFAEAVDKLLNNNELRKEYANNAKKRVLDHFVMEKIKPQIEKIYEELISDQ